MLLDSYHRTVLPGADKHPATQEACQNMTDWKAVGSPKFRLSVHISQIMTGNNPPVSRTALKTDLTD